MRDIREMLNNLHIEINWRKKEYSRQLERVKNQGNCVSINDINCLDKLDQVIDDARIAKTRLEEVLIQKKVLELALGEEENNE